MSKTIESGHINRTKNIPIDEVGSTQGIEVISGNATGMDAIELEAFMNEKVLIQLEGTSGEGELRVATPNVNGRNMPIRRGVPTWVRRTYVEALVHARTSNYSQRIANAMEPDSLEMVEDSRPSVGFAVLEDSSRGRDWLNLLMQNNV